MLFGGDPREASAGALAAVAAEVPGHGLEAGEALAEGVELAPGARAHRAGHLAGRGPPPAGPAGDHASTGSKVDPDRRLGSADVLHGRWVLLRKGKRDWAVVDGPG